MVYQLQMAKLLSILGPMTNLIDKKCCILNGEKDYVFGLWSKIYFWLIFDPFLKNNGKNRVKQDGYDTIHYNKLQYNTIQYYTRIITFSLHY